MTSIKLIVKGSTACAQVDGLLASGMVGIPVTIEYDSAWDGLTKNLVCRSGEWYGPVGGETRTILNVGTTATVAHEVMTCDKFLYLGVEGFNADGTLVIPTIWADCGKIFSGANSDGDPSADPTLPVWAQLKQRVDNLEENGVPAGTVELDSSLSASGKAADAAAAGEAIAAISGLRWRGEFDEKASYRTNDVFTADGTVMVYYETPDDEELVGYWAPLTDLCTQIAANAKAIAALEENSVEVPDSSQNGNAVKLPSNEDGTPNYGTVGQFAVSDGAGGISWITVADGNEVAY